jgi:putative ABC transport system ATP-binding protein
MLELTQVSKSYSGTARVLGNVSFSLGRGEYVAIMGESGVGKSTLLNVIAGLDLPDQGRVYLDGRDITRLNDDERTHLRRAQLGFVFQAFHLLPYLDVEQNIALPLVLNGAVDKAQRLRVAELAHALGLGARLAHYPRELSGGEMQRVAIARALVHQPLLVLADEPTGNLDAESGTQVLELLRTHIKHNNAAGILVTHSSQAAATTDRVYRLTAQGLHLA